MFPQQRKFRFQGRFQVKRCSHCCRCCVIFMQR